MLGQMNDRKYIKELKTKIREGTSFKKIVTYIFHDSRQSHEVTTAAH